MNNLFIIIVIVVSFLIGISFAIKRRSLLNKYWLRRCAGREWLKQFPDVRKEDIREFLEAFVDGFAFSSKKRLKFSPDDKVMDIYRSSNPEGGVDALELETFAENLNNKYKFDLSQITNQDITLGEIFKMIIKEKS